jgi:hypothetical protein
MLDLAADQVKTMFEGVSFSGISPRGPATPREATDDGHWTELVVVTPVYYYETK